MFRAGAFPKRFPPVRGLDVFQNEGRGRARGGDFHFPPEIGGFDKKACIYKAYRANGMAKTAVSASF